MKFSTALIVLVSFVVAGSAASVPVIKADVAVVAEQISKLDASISAVPDVAGGATIPQITAIATNAKATISALEKGTVDIKGSSTLNDPDAKAILALVKPYVTIVLHALGVIVKKKIAFTAGEVVLIGPVLKDINQAATAFGSALVDTAPASTVADAKQIQKTVKDALTVALAAYP
ncbi:hypothetical protein Hypma_001620 [Hypsizygus marmoreus]|uniref:Uncharacterized protein n=1 Tax=Hypsizygus marmoreus TaxID=39966 RepID=A0A369J5X5_HYPMA|nr:hypothetical protein Hypma_001620 [Hypsizygus marmoreus]